MKQWEFIRDEVEKDERGWRELLKKEQQELKTEQEKN